MAALTRESVLAERLCRQRLSEPLETPRRYEALFRLLQPVSTISDVRPGSPPRLVCRTAFDQDPVADRLRSKRAIVKGRFLGGSIGYVWGEDLELYANAFSRPLMRPTAIQKEVLEAVSSAGPVTARQLREETQLLAKQIMPALHRLQEAFLVYEDQVDREWDRAWYDFSTEWPEVRLTEELRSHALAQVLRRFLEGHVFATFEQLSDWTRIPRRTLRPVLLDLEQSDALLPREVEGLGEGWIRAEDEKLPAGSVPGTVFLFHSADPLTRSHASELKRRFGDREVLRYLLIDGAFTGAVLGHWRFAPYDVEDIVIELPAKECMRIRDAVLDLVREVYAPPRHSILKYAGRPVRSRGRSR